MALLKRLRKVRKRAKSRKLLPDADEIPQIEDDAEVPDIALGGGQK